MAPAQRELGSVYRKPPGMAWIVMAVGCAAVSGCAVAPGASDELVSGTVQVLSCEDLAQTSSEFLVGNPRVVQDTIKSSVVAAKAEGANVPATPAHCRVEFTYSGALEGPADGYDKGQKQLIRMRVFLPLSAADGGAGGVQGNWNGKQMVGTSGRNSGDPEKWAAFAEGTAMNDVGYAVRLGYIGSNTDTGQGNPPHILIDSGPLARTIALGTVEDWASRATYLGKRMAGAIATTYYGRAPGRVYLNGCSGGANQALGQLQKYGGEYDGALLGAPANYRTERFLGFDAWPALVLKKLVQQGGTIPTAVQRDAANAAATASCDVQGGDTVADGIVADPRACRFSAKANICGAPGAPAAPACLTPAQADAIDRIWDGPRNRFGDRVYFGWDRGLAFPLSPDVSSGVRLVLQWNHADPLVDAGLLFSDPESIALAGHPAGAMSYDDEAALSAGTVGQHLANREAPAGAFKARGGKIIHLHGTQDPLINWQQSVDYYRRTAAAFGNGTADFTALQSWYRFFPEPGRAHCGITVRDGKFLPDSAVAASDPFLALVDWVENGKAPQSLPAKSAAKPGVSRKLCPYPQTALYKGSGSVDDAANYSCGGSLDTQQAVCDSVRTQFKLENRRNLDFAGLGVDPAMCPGLAP